MRTSTWVWIVIVILVLAGAWYWWSSSQNAAMTTPPTSAPMIPATSSTTSGTQNPSAVGNNLALGVDSSASLGQYLTAYNGMTIYTYANDSVGTTTCYGTCAQNWPPYTISTGTALNLQAGVNGTIGTITRADGTTQVTYNGMPLYFYSKDVNAGDTNGQGVGGVWYVVKP